MGSSRSCPQTWGVTWGTLCPRGQDKALSTSLTYPRCWRLLPVPDRPLAVSKLAFGADTMPPCLQDYFLFG